MTRTINTVISLSSIKTCVLDMKTQCECCNIGTEIVLGFFFGSESPAIAYHRGNPVSIPVSMSCDIFSLKITKRLLFVMGGRGDRVFCLERTEWLY